jgi:hypothetical protein
MTQMTSKAAGAMLAAALDYAARGWLVLPLHSADDSRCSCGNADCGSVGKHPRLVNGLKGASVDPAVISGWWRRWPDANVGLVTGSKSGLLALDVDVQHGGGRSLAELERTHGELPSTAETLTGGGGRHLFFSYPDAGARNTAGKLSAGIDIRGEGGYVVAPPSVHASGRAYKWTQAPNKTATAPPPDWLVSENGKGASAPAADERIVVGQRSDGRADFRADTRLGAAVKGGNALDRLR